MTPLPEGCATEIPDTRASPLARPPTGAACSVPCGRSCRSSSLWRQGQRQAGEEVEGAKDRLEAHL